MRVILRAGVADWVARDCASGFLRAPYATVTAAAHSMPPSDPAASLCAHIVPGAAPFAIELVLDDAGGPTDALVRCRHCGAHWLLEMLDWRGRERLMRVSPLCASRVTALLANLERGSCDSGRAAAEVASATASVIALPCLLALDGRDFSITRLLALPPEQQMPRAGWRTLPCDGRWFDRAG